MVNRKLKVKVIGLGGIGGYLLPPLCRVLNYGSAAFSIGEIELVLIDGDQYDEQDRDGQPFWELGNKATVAAKYVEQEFSKLKAAARPIYLDENNAGLLIEEGDLVFLCVDNHKTRRMVSRHCEGTANNVVVISSAIAFRDGSVQVFIRKDGRNLTDPLDSLFHPEIQYPTDKHPSEAKDEKAVCRPQLLIANNMAAALMLNAFHGWLTDVFSVSCPFRYDEVLFDLPSNSVRTIARSPRPSFRELVQEKAGRLKGRRRKP